MLQAGMIQAVLWDIRWRPKFTKSLMMDYYSKMQLLLKNFFLLRLLLGYAALVAGGYKWLSGALDDV